MKQLFPTLALYIAVYTNPDPICLLLASVKKETAHWLSDNDAYLIY